jgi:hypothetical protein
LLEMQLFKRNRLSITEVEKRSTRKYWSWPGFNVQGTLNKDINPKEKLSGIGEISTIEDPEKTTYGYQRHLGLTKDTCGTNFISYQGVQSVQKGFTLHQIAPVFP